MFLSAMFLITISSHSASHALSRPVLPNPVLYLMSQESYTTGSKNFIRYKYDVLNKEDYPAEMFAPAPGLPPCGANTNSSRTGSTSLTRGENGSTDSALWGTLVTLTGFGFQRRMAKYRLVTSISS
ncbi:MAG: hypothetical protein ACR2H4_08420 [Pyrinomonadaceae bacterium]|jgi:hypothetical protein